MTYIDYCNQFWRCHLEYSFSPSAAMVYFKLLDLANSLRWKPSFAYSDPQLCAATGVSTNTLKSVRQQLAGAGLLHFVPGGHGRGQAFKTVYTLLTVGEEAPQKGSVIPSKIDTITDPFPAAASPENHQGNHQTNYQNLTPLYKEEEKTREEGVGASPAVVMKNTAAVLSEALPEPWATILAGPAKRVQQLEEPLTAAELAELLASYTDQAVDKVLRAMGNRPDLLKKNVSARATVEKWLSYDEAEGKPVRRAAQVATAQPGQNPYVGKPLPASTAAWLAQRKQDEPSYPDEL